LQPDDEDGNNNNNNNNDNDNDNNGCPLGRRTLSAWINFPSVRHPHASRLDEHE